MTGQIESLEINGVTFVQHPDIGFKSDLVHKEVEYRYNYFNIAQNIKSGMWPEIDTYRALIQNDLWFVLFFVVKPFTDEEGKSKANHPFVVKACNEIQDGPKDFTLDIYAREHFKTSIITIAETIQYQLNNPECCTGLFSYVAPKARQFLFSIRSIFEKEKILSVCFPDVVWADPQKEAPMWSLDQGIILKRKTNRQEPTIGAYGLTEGMPTGLHFERRVYDDIVTEDVTGSIDLMDKIQLKFDSSQNLGKEGGHHRVTGTYYDHRDPLIYIRNKTAIGENGEQVPAYLLRLKPATDDGTATGKPILLSQKRLDQLKLTKTFNCHAAKTKVLMSDFSEKNIEDIAVGDKVISFVKDKRRTRLVVSDVQAVFSREAEAKKYTFASGSSTICTPDHKWWGGRWNSGIDNRLEYWDLEDVGENKTRKRGLIKMFTSIPDIPDDPNIIKACAYLGGIYDGEGSFSSNKIRLFQSEKHNPEVCKKIREQLDIAGFNYIETNTNHKSCIEWRLLNGREETLKFAKWCEISKWKNEIYKSALLASKNGSSKKRDYLISSESVGVITVYGFQTSIGNYIANGYASKNCQQLLDPTPLADQRLNPEYLSPIERKFIPSNVYRFMVIDQAGDVTTNKSGDGDSWAIGVFAVEPVVDDIGQSKVYIDDLWINPASVSEAIEQAVRMYMKGGIIQKLGVERVSQTTTHVHIADALRAKGRHIMFGEVNEGHNGILLRPAGRTKKFFIESALSWPLNNGKWFYCTDVPAPYIERLKMEMTNFPLWHDDGLNVCAYLYDILQNYHFRKYMNVDFTRSLRLATVPI